MPCGPPLLRQPPVLDRERGPIGDGAQQMNVVGVEPAPLQRPDVQNAHQAPLDDQRHAEERAHAVRPQQRIYDLDRGVLEVLDHHWLAARRNATREPRANRKLKAALDLLLEALRRAGGHYSAVLLQEQDRSRIAVEDVFGSVEELRQQIVEVEIGECRRSYALQGLDGVLLVRSRGSPLLVRGALHADLAHERLDGAHAPSGRGGPNQDDPPWTEQYRCCEGREPKVYAGTRPHTYHARAWRSNAPSGSPSLLSTSSRSSRRVAPSSDARYLPE